MLTKWFAYVDSMLMSYVKGKEGYTDLVTKDGRVEGGRGWG